MKKYLIYQDGNSSKFWEIETSGKSFTVTYGRIGAKGQTQTKDFPTEEKCSKEAEKLLNEKLKKGYVETESGAAPTTSANKDYLQEWEALVNAPNRHEALVKHFSFLLDTPGATDAEELLSTVMERVTDIKIKKDEDIGNRLEIHFSSDFHEKDGLLLSATAPKVIVNNKWPKSFHDICAHHETLTAGDTVSFDREYLSAGWDEAIECLKDEELDKNKKWLLKALNFLGNGNDETWIYHPTEKNKFGEPSIYYIGDEFLEEMEPAPCLEPHNVGLLFLKRLSQNLYNSLSMMDDPFNPTRCKKFSFKEAITEIKKFKAKK